jgi:hypothetical protein
MHCLLQAAEIWTPDSDATLLEFGAGWYDSAVEFGAISRAMCFGRAEGLPGRSWDEGRPVLLTDLQSGYFRRAAAARKAGLSCAVALPFHFANRLKAVVVLFFGGHQREEGAVELWHHDPLAGKQMSLVDGHYGTTARALLADAREQSLARGSGLPGLAWQRGASVFVDAVAESPDFVRGAAAAQAQLRHGLALPCSSPGDERYVLALLGTAAAPIARRVECWVPSPEGATLQRAYGHCEVQGSLPVGERITTAGVGEDTIALAFASAVPQIRQRAADEPGRIGEAAAAAGLGGLLVLPVVSGGIVTEAVALYL